MHKIKTISLLFRILFQLMFIFIPLLLFISWVFAPFSLENANQGILLMFTPIPKGLAVHYPLSATAKIMGFLITGISTAITELILYFLIKLFRLFERGEIFTLKNVKYIKSIGYALLISQIIDPISQILVSIALTWHNMSGQREAMATFSGINLGLVLFAFMIILISWIMAEGCKLSEEQQYIV